MFMSAFWLGDEQMNDCKRVVAVFGANGLTGRLLIERLLDRGWCVRAITRHPDAIQVSTPRLEVARADATNPAHVAEVVQGCYAITSVLGVRYSKHPINSYSASAHAIVGAMQAQAIRRLIVTSSMVVTGWRDPEMNWFARTLITQFLERIGSTLYDDMRRMEHIVSQSDLDWTIMRPLGLASMDAPTKYAVARDHIAGRQTARRDLAAAIADQLDLTTDLRAAVAIATTNKTQNLPLTIWREGIKPNLFGRSQ